MQALFDTIGLSLFTLAILTFVIIVRDVFSILNTQDQTSLRGSGTESGLRARRKYDRAIGDAWNEHVRSFPKSRKRVLFAVLLIAAALSVMGYPLWQALGTR